MIILIINRKFEGINNLLEKFKWNLSSQQIVTVSRWNAVNAIYYVMRTHPHLGQTWSLVYNNNIYRLSAEKFMTFHNYNAKIP